MRIRNLLWTLSLSGVFSVVVASAADKNDSAATSAARNWLSKIDHGAYAVAWTDAAGYLKANVPQQTFLQQLEGVRKPLGNLVSRKLLAKKQLDSVPGGPVGKYVVLQYNTTFTHKKAAVETITPMLEKDGKWKVSGYFIR